MMKFLSFFLVPLIGLGYLLAFALAAALFVACLPFILLWVIGSALFSRSPAR